MKVLLSIKPEFAEKIFEGTKKYEFRRTIFKNPDVKTVVVYASSPVQKVIGEFEVDCILTDDLEKIWQETEKFAGIDKSYFMSYFNKKEHAYAIKVKKTKRYKKLLNLKESFGINPPQSFAYIEEANS
ncbi:MAG TPA: ASCH domain-containing protein [bacterium]|mgnify:CR=1 FL=1|nr:ASCH domain-containing protein [bacterium]HRQ70175.1 ASCH domain-containing protein [bacterium]